jgi:hypothetical protein
VVCTPNNIELIQNPYQPHVLGHVSFYTYAAIVVHIWQLSIKFASKLLFLRCPRTSAATVIYRYTTMIEYDISFSESDIVPCDTQWIEGHTDFAIG